MAGQLAPAVGRHLAVLGIQADDDVAAKGTAGVLQKTRVLDRSRADDHVAQPAVYVFLDGVQIADAATELHRNVVADGTQDGLDRRRVLRLAGKGAVQVHQVQAPGALLHPFQCHRRRVLPEGGRLVHVTLLESYAVAVF